MPKSVAIKSCVAAEKAAARSLLLWIITHFLVVSSFLRLKIAKNTTSRHKQHQAKHQLDHHGWLSLIILVLLAPSFFTHCHAIGYSYARFVGPVSGPEHEIIVHDELNGGTRVDYVARPEYQFAYGVEDSETHVLQNHKETRNGDAVKGLYSVVDPDGTLRVVKYTADDANGFQAEVITDGIATIHGHGNDGGVGGLNANNGGSTNWHITNGKDDADANNDNDDYDSADDGDADSKNDYEVYEEHSEHLESDENNDIDDDDAGKSIENSDASAENSHEDAEDDGGGYEESNYDDDHYDDDDYY